jgi:two-component system phosphate regulon sensor histidine kinase PhoR
MAQQTTMNLDLHAVRKDGVEFDIQLALAPILENRKVVGVVCDIHDVSTFREGERLKDNFVSNVSHELRTPITSMRLNTTLLRGNPEKQDVYLDRLMRDLDRLGQLIEDLLQLSRLDQRRGDLVFRPLDLNAWASSLIEDYRVLAGDKQQTLTLTQQPGLPPVEADGGFLGQVLGNLLNNAINYTPPGGKIFVSTDIREADGKAWAGFTVRDTGPGFLPEEQERLFERFYRGRAGRAARAPGPGLGLALAREIVGLHHGEIEIHSTGIEGEGALFRIWLPGIPLKTD